jgi:hypothetical protein
MISADNSVIELGNNFAIQQRGWLNPAAGGSKWLIYKQGAFQTYVSANNTVVAIIYNNETRLPSANNTTGITTVVGNSTHWGAVTTSDDDTSYVSTAVAAEEIDYYEVQTPAALGATDTITGVNLTASYKATGGVNQGSIRLRLMLGGSTSNSAEMYYGSGGSYSGWSWDALSSRPGGGNWTASDFNSLRIGAGLTAYSAEMRLSYLALLIDFERSATVSNVVSGETNVTTTFNGVALGLTVGNSTSTTVGTTSISVPNTAYQYYYVYNNVMPYMEYTRIWVNNTLKQSIAWENNTTFNDLSGNGQSATPSFRTATSNNNVTANLTNYIPYNPAKLGSVNETVTGLAGNTPTAPDEWFTEDAPTLPGASIINSFLDLSSTPHALFWGPYVGLGAVAIIFGIYGLTRSGMGKGSLMLSTVGALLWVALHGLTKVVSLWLILPFAIVLVAVVIKGEGNEIS